MLHTHVRKPLTLFFLALTAPLAVSQTPPAPGPPPTLQIALTFDDLPAHGPLAPGQQRRDVVNSILKTLKTEGLPPSYGFVNSFRMDHHPYQIEILQAWVDAGNPLGNHTYSHEELDTQSLKAFATDVAANETVLRRLTPNPNPDNDFHWFRFPYMEEGDTIDKREGALQILHSKGYTVAEVSMNFQDYRWNDAYGLCSARHNTNAINILHDTYLAAADEYITRFRDLTQVLYHRDIPYILLLHVGSFDARMLPELIALYRAKGFTFITLPEAAADPVYAEELHTAIKGGSTFQELVAHSRNITVPPDSAIFQQVNALCH